jgi:hypothetical protein
MADLRKGDEWGFYFPEDGETIEDTVPIIGRTYDAAHAAEMACEYDYSSRDGWERKDIEFKIVVVSPENVETVFIGVHEPTVAHRVHEARP